MKKKRVAVLFLMLGFALSACKSEQASTESQTEAITEIETGSETNSEKISETNSETASETSSETSSEKGIEDIEKNEKLVGTIDSKSIKNYRCTLTVKNLDDRAIDYDKDLYVIEVWKDKQWVPVQELLEYRFSGAIQSTIQPGKELTGDIYWIDEYGELSPGKYRLLISATYYETREEAGKIVAEFQIEDENDTAVDGLPTGEMYDPKIYKREIPEYGILAETVELDREGCDLKVSYTENDQVDPVGFKVGEDYCLQKWDPEKEQWETIHAGFADGVKDTNRDVPATVQIRWKEILGEQLGVYRIIVPVVADQNLGDYKVFFLSRVLVVL